MFLTFEFYLRVVDIRKYSRGSQIFIQKNSVYVLFIKIKIPCRKFQNSQIEVFDHIIKKIIIFFLRPEIFSNENLFGFFPDLLIRSFL